MCARSNLTRRSVKKKDEKNTEESNSECLIYEMGLTSSNALSYKYLIMMRSCARQGFYLIGEARMVAAFEFN